MIKSFFKKFFYRIYTIGFQQDYQKKRTILKNTHDGNCVMNDTVVIGENTRIINQTGAKEKITIGDNSIIFGELLVLQQPGKISIGTNVFIGEHTRIWSSRSIKIGDRVLISHDVNIHDNVSHSLDSKARHEEFLYAYKYRKPMPKDDQSAQEVIIEDDVWIGFNSTILKGVRIGKGAIIGACTLITKDVEDFAVMAGNPARLIKYTI